MTPERPLAGTASLTRDRSHHLPAVHPTRVPDAGEPDALGVHRRLGLFVEAVEEYAIFSLDPTGAVQSWNVGAHRIKGYDEHEIIGRHFSIFYLPEEREAGVPAEHLAHAIAHGHRSGEGWRLRKDGSRFWANVAVTAVFDHDGVLEGFVKVTRDETDRKIAEENSRRLDLLHERERIAIELADVTVRNIISATLALDSALAMGTDPGVAQRLWDAITTLDRTLTHIRTAVTGLRSARDLTAPTDPAAP